MQTNSPLSRGRLLERRLHQAFPLRLPAASQYTSRQVDWSPFFCAIHPEPEAAAWVARTSLRIERAGLLMESRRYLKAEALAAADASPAVAIVPST